MAEETVSRHTGPPLRHRPRYQPPLVPYALPGKRRGLGPAVLRGYHRGAGAGGWGYRQGTDLEAARDERRGVGEDGERPRVGG